MLEPYFKRSNQRRALDAWTKLKLSLLVQFVVRYSSTKIETALSRRKRMPLSLIFPKEFPEVP